jgi:hypothetical protein
MPSKIKKKFTSPVCCVLVSKVLGLQKDTVIWLEISGALFIFTSTGY